VSEAHQEHIAAAALGSGMGVTTHNGKAGGRMAMKRDPISVPRPKLNRWDLVDESNDFFRFIVTYTIFKFLWRNSAI
jgi:hypothetical protein